MKYIRTTVSAATGLYTIVVLVFCAITESFDMRMLIPCLLGVALYVLVNRLVEHEAEDEAARQRESERKAGKSPLFVEPYGTSKEVDEERALQDSLNAGAKRMLTMHADVVEAQLERQRALAKDAPNVRRQLKAATASEMLRLRREEDRKKLREEEERRRALRDARFKKEQEEDEERMRRRRREEAADDNQAVMSASMFGLAHHRLDQEPSSIEPAPAPFESGRGGDYAGAGASGSWDAEPQSAPSPAPYEPPPAPSYMPSYSPSPSPSYESPSPSPSPSYDSSPSPSPSPSSSDSGGSSYSSSD